MDELLMSFKMSGTKLDGGFKHFLFLPLTWGDINMFQMGWFNHQLGKVQISNLHISRLQPNLPDRGSVFDYVVDLKQPGDGDRVQGTVNLNPMDVLKNLKIRNAIN